MSKRNRVVRSSSLGDVGLFSAIRPIESVAGAAHFEKKRPTPEETRRSVLTIGSPVQQQSDEGPEKVAKVGFGAFLESCHFCRRKIAEQDDVFMSEYLRAFCSLDCRNMQTANDEEDRRSPPKSTETIVENFLMKGMARQGLNNPAGRLSGA